MMKIKAENVGSRYIRLFNCLISYHLLAWDDLDRFSASLGKQVGRGNWLGMTRVREWLPAADCSSDWSDGVSATIISAQSLTARGWVIEAILNRHSALTVVSPLNHMLLCSPIMVMHLKTNFSSTNPLSTAGQFEGEEKWILHLSNSYVIFNVWMLQMIG